MMKRIIGTLLLLAIVSAGVLFAVKADQRQEPDGRLQVVASYYPLFEFAREIGGEQVSVKNMTPAGAEPHGYEPSAKALVDAKRAKLFIYNGEAFEPWVADFLSDYTAVAVKASEGMELMSIDYDPAHPSEHIGDPHYWLDPQLAKKAAANIRDGLIKADPGQADLYRQRTVALQQKLDTLDKAFLTGLKDCQEDTIVASHNAFSYVAARFEFTVVPIAGLSPETEPSADRLAELSNKVRDEGIGYVFFESLVSPRLADTIASEAGVQTLVLDPIEGLTDEAQKQGKDYFSVQRENLESLRRGLACE